MKKDLNYFFTLTRKKGMHIIKQNTNDQGLVLVSTGVWKLGKPSVAGHYVKSSI